MLPSSVPTAVAPPASPLDRLLSALAASKNIAVAAWAQALLAGDEQHQDAPDQAVEAGEVRR